MYAKLHDSVNAVRFLQEGRIRIGYLQEAATSTPSILEKIFIAIFKKLYSPTNFYSGREKEIVGIFKADIDRYLTTSRQQAQSPTLVVDFRTDRRSSFRRRSIDL